MELHRSQAIFIYIWRRWNILWKGGYTTKPNYRRSTPDYPPNLLTNPGPTIGTTLAPIQSPAVIPPKVEVDP